MDKLYATIFSLNDALTSARSSVSVLAALAQDATNHSPDRATAFALRVALETVGRTKQHVRALEDALNREQAQLEELTRRSRP